jgi:hypothetical protein
LNTENTEIASSPHLSSGYFFIKEKMDLLAQDMSSIAHQQLISTYPPCQPQLATATCAWIYPLHATPIFVVLHAKLKYAMVAFSSITITF